MPRDHDVTQWLERNGWHYAGNDMWRPPDGGRTVTRNDAIGAQNRRDALRQQRIPREIFHVVTKSGKVVGPAELTREDIEVAVEAANKLPEALIYGPYTLAHYKLVES